VGGTIHVYVCVRVHVVLQIAISVIAPRDRPRCPDILPHWPLYACVLVHPQQRPLLPLPSQARIITRMQNVFARDDALQLALQAPAASRAMTAVSYGRRPGKKRSWSVFSEACRSLNSCAHHRADVGVWHGVKLCKLEFVVRANVNKGALVLGIVAVFRSRKDLKRSANIFRQLTTT